MGAQGRALSTTGDIMNDIQDLAHTAFNRFNQGFEDIEHRPLQHGDCMIVAWYLRLTFRKQGLDARGYHGRVNGSNHWWIQINDEIIDPLGELIFPKPRIYKGSDHDADLIAEKNAFSQGPE